MEDCSIFNFEEKSPANYVVIDMTSDAFMVIGDREVR